MGGGCARPCDLEKDSETESLRQEAGGAGGLLTDLQVTSWQAKGIGSGTLGAPAPDLHFSLQTSTPV